MFNTAMDYFSSNAMGIGDNTGQKSTCNWNRDRELSHEQNLRGDAFQKKKPTRRTSVIFVVLIENPRFNSRGKAGDHKHQIERLQRQ